MPQDIDDEDLLIRSDNVFGEAHEDAIRRDFTINALFYDLDRRQVLDWCGGMEDIAKRTIRTINEPSVRFREDPVRILRAIKFAARLDLGIEPTVYDAMISHRDDLARAARPRVYEEVLRLLRHGASHRSMWIMWESGVMSVLIPELAAFLDDEESHPEAVARFWRQLDALDRMTHARGQQLEDIVLMTTLFYEPMVEAMASTRDRMRAATEFLIPITERIAIPRRVMDGMRRMVALIPRLKSGRTPARAKGEMFVLAQRLVEIVSASPVAS